MKKSHYIFLILALALFPSTASANAGTPLMWALMLHLVVGNAIIGLIEGILLARLFKCSIRKSILILIGANYTSAWAGGLLVTEYLPSQVDITIQNLQIWFLTFVAVAFVVTLLIEFAFFWFALGSRVGRLQRTLAATLTVNGTSYVLLFCWYWIASGTSMLTQLEVVSVDEIKLSQPYALYYLSKKGDQIIRMDPTKPSSKEVISYVKAPHRNDRLFARPRQNSGFDLFLYLESEDREAITESRILEDFSEQAPVDLRTAGGNSVETVGSWSNYGQVPNIGPVSNWTFRTGFWAVEGISGKSEKTGKKVNYSLELPFIRWPVRNATQIASGCVVGQLADDQIFMLDLDSGKIALIARGKGPIIAIPKMAKP